MDPRTPGSSELANSVRNLAISRRGGVRTRGGRLPPSHMRELPQCATTARKVVLPNIPQRRRVVVKRETGTPTTPVVKPEKNGHPQNFRGRGRQQKVYLQMEGTFLAEGPAARTKKGDSCEGFSLPRSSRKAADPQAAPELPKYGLLGSYDESESDEDDFGTRAPYRLPFRVEKRTRKVKSEPDGVKKENALQKIKLEPGLKEEIKQESTVDAETRVIKTEDEDEKCNPPHDEKGVAFTAAKFLNVTGDGTLILLQLPRLSASLVKDEGRKNDKGKEESQPQKAKAVSAFVDNLEEGHIGKLQIMKSGRTRIMLGSVEFEILEGNESDSYGELVSLQIQRGEGDLAILGKIRKKMVLCPTVNRLLANSG